MSIGCIVGFVLGIVLLLLSFFVPFGSKVMINTRSGSSKAQIKSLEMAVRGYQTEYNRFPSLESPPPDADNVEGYDTTSAHGRGILAILMATDTSKNPRGISFYEPPVSKGGRGYTKERGLVDVWGAKGYVIIFDYDGDKKIIDPEHSGSTIAANVIVYSAGPDGDFNTWKDNVKSWEP
jgi:hypothetical protein